MTDGEAVQAGVYGCGAGALVAISGCCAGGF